ncbi:hypothetical protein BJF96_g9140 [Verticillium dahliae]|uniref:Inositol-pentakisphosphate 2-kinase n=1 Tax=Verticillium dahliae TaxID=27337 RepID=A0AA44W9W5_VERDA|nr:hypothetical protein BJF96_g9140 [Verticillium dahliae]PNH56701.1 hypothetical protein VD0003_g1018 [Verticillium dahliae]
MSNTQRPPGIPRLGDKWLEFVGEGAANTVWALHFIDDSGGDAYTQHVRQLCDGFLLRIQKHTKGGDSAISATDQLAYVQETILPALNNDASLIVRQKLIQVTQPLIDECNALLAAMDDNSQPRRDEPPSAPLSSSSPLPHPHLPRRAAKFVGSRVGPAGAHMLTQDMRPRRPERERFAEIKPKWLAQSPTAPRGANTCRNCAVAASRWHAAPADAKPKKSDPDRYGCPLRLVAPSPASAEGKEETRENGEKEKRENGAKELKEGEAAEPWHGHAERIFRGEDARVARFLFAEIRRHEALRFLRDLQARFARRDTFLATTPAAPDEDLLVAMTLRDCSLFFRYEDGEDGALRLLDFTLADLDKKTPAKIPSWQKTERELIDGGWYEGKQGCGMPNCYLKEGRAEDETRADVTRLKDASKLGVAYRE